MPLPSSWFYKLRRKRSTERTEPGDDAAGFTITSKPGSHQALVAASSPAVLPLPCSSPNRASYYLPSRDRRLPSRPAVDNPRLRDTQFPRSPQPNDIVFDIVADRFDGLKAMPELKLRPILTRPAAKKDGGEASDSGTSLAASPTARVRRFHAKPSGRRKGGRMEAQPPEARPQKRRARGRRRWLYESLVVVKESVDPEEDFLESMSEMIAESGVRSPRDLEELLACYLTLNAAEHHRAIVGAFRRAWLDTTTNAKQS